MKGRQETMKRPPENETSGRNKRKCLRNSAEESSISDIYEEGELGIIESVTVQNFMCHENLTLNFEPHMNFIIGNNGSGKSAIATAIILALGGKSSSTDRHANIKSFIKNGKNEGKVEVVLRNEGSLAYKPEVYGRKIIIIREFTKGGGSNYKIKSETGTITSTQKSELNNILEAMDIMVECPVCVLTQTTSKKFLISQKSKEEQLFEYFYKGTGLEVLENKYKAMTIMQEEAEGELQKKKKRLLDLNEDLKKWEKFVDNSNKIYDYKNEQIWAIAIEIEKRVQDKETQCKMSEKEFQQLKMILEECEKSLTEKSFEWEELEKKRTNAESEMKNCSKMLKEIDVQSEKIVSSCRNYKDKLQKLESEKKQLEDEKFVLEKCIGDHNIKDQTVLEMEKKEREEEMNKLKDQNSTLQNELRNLKGNLNTTRDEESNFKTVIANLSAEVECNSNELKKIEENLTNIENAIKDSANAFGRFTDKVNLEIKKSANRFKKLPIGPIGAFLDVEDSKWAAAVECAVGSSLLDSYCVDNLEDSLLLRFILKKFYSMPPSIIISPFESQIYDVQQGKVQSCFLSVLDVLECKHHQIANCVIDQAQIEKKILIANEKEAMSLLNSPPKNCISAYFMNCDEICFRPSRIYLYEKSTPTSRMRGSRDDACKKFKMDKDEKTAKIEELKQQIKTMESALESYPEKTEKLQQDILKAYMDIKLNLSEIEELQYKDKTENVDCLLKDFENVHFSYEEKAKEIERCSQVISELQTKRNDLLEQKEVRNGLLQQLKEENLSLLIELDNVSKLKERFASKLKTHKVEVKRKENTYKNHKKKLEEQKTKLKEALTRAESTCRRIDTEKSVDELTRLIANFEGVLEAESECNRENLVKRYQEMKKNKQRAEIELEKMERHLKRIGDMLEKRQTKFSDIRVQTELLIGIAFTTILSRNGYGGSLHFDHKNRSLSLRVSPKAGEPTRRKHGSLSGGERSFVTLAFLLALWERTRMPFRILDEYDVFMDSSNKELSVDLLCRKVPEMLQTQFIFLAVELPRMPTTNFVRILKMAAPKRKA